MNAKSILKNVNAPTAKRSKVNNQEAARHGITNMNATRAILSRQGLTKIPDFVFYMKNLRLLDLSHNKLTSLPAEIGKLNNLQELRLANNKLTSLPAEIGKLNNLRGLRLSDNKLTSLPASICLLTNLSFLHVHGNELTSLPAEIGKLKKLRELRLSDNKLTSLPESIGLMTNLRWLELTGNKLTSLPESFKKLHDYLLIDYRKGWPYTLSFRKEQFMKLFGPPKRINKNTELLNNAFLPTNNIPRGKRVYLNIPSNVKNNKTLRRVYNKNGVTEFLRRKGERARLHGNTFTANNVKPLNNKNFNIQRIRARLLNTPLNKMKTTIEGLKNRLPPNVSRTDVNDVVRKIKAPLLNKIRNKLRTTPENNRRTLINRYRRDGLINNRDVL